MRVVFDTNTVLSALLFPNGRLAWLREHWRKGDCVPVASRATTEELARILRYPKFGLSVEDCQELLADYLPYCEIAVVNKKCPVDCRDPKDQAFLDLAHSGKANVLVSGDSDLLELAGKTRFAIVSVVEYRRRVNDKLET